MSQSERHQSLGVVIDDAGELHHAFGVNPEEPATQIGEEEVVIALIWQRGGFRVVLTQNRD